MAWWMERNGGNDDKGEGKKRIKSHLLCANSFFVGKCADAFDPGANLLTDIYFESIRRGKALDYQTIKRVSSHLHFLRE